MNLKPRQITFIIVLLSTMISPAKAEENESADWKELFNGHNLDGWHMPAGNDKAIPEQDFFTVKDGTIHVYATQKHGSKQPFTGLFTDGSYGNYHLTLEYKWGEKKFLPRLESPMDAGICFHTHGKDVIWPSSIELQIQEGDTGDAWVIKSRATSTVNKVSQDYTADGERVTLGNEETPYSRFRRRYCWETPGWNKVEIIAKEDTATFLVNGRIVNMLTGLKHLDEQTGEYIPLTSGKILLQGEGAEVFYRNIRIKKLD